MNELEFKLKQNILDLTNAINISATLLHETHHTDSPSAKWKECPRVVCLNLSQALLETERVMEDVGLWL